MDVREAELLVRTLMRKHRLRSWTYGTNKRKKVLGLCFSRLKRIELSTNFILYNSREVVTETVLHEIAHALVGTHHGHDEVWKAKAELIGCSPTRTTRNVIMPPGKWQATCGGCGLVFYRYRRPKYVDGNCCKRCGPEVGTLFYQQAEELVPSTAAAAVAVSPAVPKDDLAVAAHSMEDIT
jgi:predicted SprT family Zn-dependent metalloprotease